MEENNANKANKANKQNKRVIRGEGYAVLDYSPEKKEKQEKQNQKKQEKQKINQAKKDFQIVDFCDIDVNEITFGTPKENNHNGLQIPILYKGKTPYVQYKGVTPFGIKENYDPVGNYLGTSMQINLEGDYLKKAMELDQFFINAFYEHKWNLSKSIPKSSIEGYDEYGQGGLWKRLCKKSYKVNQKTKEREYNDYPSKMEFVLFYRNNLLQTTIFDENKKKVQYTDVTSYSEVKFIAAWFSLCRGTFGLTLKPKLMQVKFKPEKSLFKEIVFEDSEEEVEEDEEEEEEPIRLDYNRFDLHN